MKKNTPSYRGKHWHLLGPRDGDVARGSTRHQTWDRGRERVNAAFIRRTGGILSWLWATFSARGYRIVVRGEFQGCLLCYRRQRAALLRQNEQAHRRLDTVLP